MDKNRMVDLKNRATDYKRFAFVLLSLSAFLSIGLLLPTGVLVEKDYLIIIGFIFLSILVAINLHRTAMSLQKKIYEEES